MSIAIIPARGGSKRIPRKNIKNFLGKPLISYSIEIAKESNLFDRVIVSTDSEEIAKVAIENGAEVPFLRPTSLSDDYTGIDDVLIHALDSLQLKTQLSEFVCCLFATAPMIQVEYLKKGLDLIRLENSTTVFSVTSYPYSIFRSLRINEHGGLEMFWPQYRNARSQDLEEAFHDAGQFYWINTRKYLKEGRLFSNNSFPIIIPRYFVQDIDTEEDWTTAEHLYQVINR